MLKGRWITSLMAVLLVAFSANSASAVFYTLNGTWDVEAGDPAIGPPVVDPVATFTGKTYTNTYSVPGPGGGVGSQVRTLFAAEITTIRNGVSFSPVRGLTPDYDDRVIVIAALDGTVTSVVGADATVTFTAGRAGLTTVAPNTFNASDPTTWGFGTDDAPNTYAEWILKPQEPVFAGTASNATSFQINWDASIVNQGSVNSSDQDQDQARFLFREDSPDGLVPGNDFVNIDLTDPAMIAALAALGISPGDIADEGIAITTQGTQRERNEDHDADAAAQLVLNDIGLWAGLGSVGGAAGNGFADFAAGDITDWEPLTQIGDFRTLGNGQSGPGIQVGVPEPASILLGLGGLAALGLRRRKQVS